MIAWCYAPHLNHVASRYNFTFVSAQTREILNCKVSTVTVLFGAYLVEVVSDHISPGQKQASGPR